MKILKKAVVFILLATMLLASCQLFVSCGDKEPDKGQLLATYSGGEIYESDVKEWQTFMFHLCIDDVLQASDKQAALYSVFDRATDYVVKMTAFKDLLSKEGLLTITESGVKLYAETLIKDINDDFTGGYEKWKKSFEVSDDFIYSYAEMQLLSVEMEKYIMSKYGVITDEMVDEYWSLHAGDYVQVPKYYFDNIVVSLPKSEMAGETAWNEIKAEAQSYIDRINAGEDFETVKQDAISKSRYATVARLYSGEASVIKTDCNGFEDVEALIAENKEAVDLYCEEFKVNFVEYADPNGNKDEYEAWYNLVNMNNEAYVKNALLSLEEGELWQTPIMSVFGYQIMKMTKIDDGEAVYFKKPSDDPEVRRDVESKIYEQLWDSGNGPAVEEFEEKFVKDYDIKIVYSYSTEYSKGNLK